MSNRNNFRQLDNLDLFRAKLIMLEFEEKGNGNFLNGNIYVEIYKHHIRIGDDIFFNVDLSLKYITEND